MPIPTSFSGRKTSAEAGGAVQSIAGSSPMKVFTRIDFFQ